MSDWYRHHEAINVDADRDDALRLAMARFEGSLELLTNTGGNVDQWAELKETFGTDLYETWHDCREGSNLDEPNEFLEWMGDVVTEISGEDRDSQGV